MSDLSTKKSSKILTGSKIMVKEPELYKVVMLNDNYTTMEFVVDVLIDIFGKSEAEARKIMLAVHKQGRGVAGVYVYDIAVSKISQVDEAAKKKGFPLKCIVEKE
ncbi:ATP-dependent Clp protease adaptor ClpS [bacterium]|nr:ATP-dependent Clp protease adaptor ClpS [bacterium]MBQ4437856.1 ATP-dependent Clp protease adaptor ClpS [bacterium]MBR4489033.1 ATP-dependent Clp protease adaptor ClpS [bacterium]